MSARSFTKTSGALLSGLVLFAGARVMAAPLRVAAASDLALAFKEVGAAYQQQSGDRVIFSFGSTGLLEQQIAHGAPFDLFAAANVSYADDAIAAGACEAKSKTRYARGRIVVWWRDGDRVSAPQKLADLAQPRFVKVAIANPAHAPYGLAAREALSQVGVWPQVRGKLVFGENVQQTLQFAQSGNAEAAIVALSLAVISDGHYLMIPESQYRPIDQALVVCGRDPARRARARAFADFINTPGGRAIMRRYGFLLPGETITASVK